MALGAIQEVEHLVQVFLKAVYGVRTCFLPVLLPSLKSGGGLDLVWGLINALRLEDQLLLILFPAVIGDIPKLMRPASLDLGVGINDL